MYKRTDRIKNLNKTVLHIIRKLNPMKLDSEYKRLLLMAIYYIIALMIGSGGGYFYLASLLFIITLPFALSSLGD